MNESTVAAPDRPAAGIGSHQRFRKIALIVGAILISTGIPLVIRMAIFGDWWFGDDELIVSSETTVITEPLREDGTPDYAAALDAAAREGVTTENNAAVAYWQAIGPAAIPESQRKEFFDKLGIPVPPADGENFVDFSEFEQQLVSDIAADHTRGDEIREGNATDDVVILSDRLSLSPDELIERALEAPWAAEEAPLLDRWLRHHDKALELVVQGTRRTYYYSPPLRDSSSDQQGLAAVDFNPAGESLRRASRMLVMRATRSVGEGDPEGAERDLLACHRLARHVAQGPTMIEWLSGSAIETTAFEGEAVLAHSGSLSRAEALRYREQLVALPSFPALADKIDRAERFECLDSLIHLEDFVRDGIENDDDWLPGSGNVSLIDTNAALVTANELYDRIVEAVEAPTPPERRKRLEEIERRFQEMKEDRGILRLITDRSGVVTDLMLATMVYPTTWGLGSKDHRQAHSELVQLAFALAAFHATEGRYPIALSELAPEYIPAIPPDLFSDEPPVYRLSRDGEGYVLYGVGENETDDGGRSFGDQPAGDDIVVRTPSVKAAFEENKP